MDPQGQMTNSMVEGRAEDGPPTDQQAVSVASFKKSESILKCMDGKTVF